MKRSIVHASNSCIHKWVKITIRQTENVCPLQICKIWRAKLQCFKLRTAPGFFKLQKTVYTEPKWTKPTFGVPGYLLWGKKKGENIRESISGSVNTDSFARLTMSSVWLWLFGSENMLTDVCLSTKFFAIVRKTIRIWENQLSIGACEIKVRREYNTHAKHVQSEMVRLWLVAPHLQLRQALRLYEDAMVVRNTCWKVVRLLWDIVRAQWNDTGSNFARRCYDGCSVGWRIASA